MSELFVKICGVTRVQDAEEIVRAGADAIGLNFYEKSVRKVAKDRAPAIRDAVSGRVELVGVFVDAPLDEMVRLAEELGLSAVQLHGNEGPEVIEQLRLQGVAAFKALRVGSGADVALASKYEGERILVDAKVEGAMGGTGQVFDWDLIASLTNSRQLILAGGLRPDNVEQAVREVGPYGVDTASGVESSPGVKDSELLKAFVENARKGLT